MTAKADKIDFGKEMREKKKKKKKAREMEEHALDMEPLVKTKPSGKSVTSPDMIPEMPLLKKKKKKMKTQEAESPDRGPHDNSMEAETIGRTTSLKKHKRKGQPLNVPEPLCQEKKKKTKSSSIPGAETGEGTELEGDFVRKTKKRKKDNKSEQESKEALFDPEEEEEEGEEEREPIEQGQGEEKQDPCSLRYSDIKKKKKKKKTYREGEKEDKEGDRTDKVPVDKGYTEDPSASTSCRKKGHKKKQPEAQSAESIPLAESIKKKEKKSKSQIESPSAEEPAQKKKKKAAAVREVVQDPQGPSMAHESDLEVVSEKKGNLNEVTINTVKRKALQDEIDRESGKTEALETKVEAPTQFGQWDTATFENSDQKMKFLRLMGGFKNSSQSLSSSPGTLGKPNMALNKQAAATLQQNLQVEFDKAMSWKHQRGVGLGYSSSANKTKLFYIDRNASRSVKFND